MELPKTLRKYAARIDDYSDERNSDSGIHVSYVRGWKSFTDPLGSVHGDVTSTVTEAAWYAKAAVPCDCEDCRRT